MVRAKNIEPKRITLVLVFFLATTVCILSVTLNFQLIIIIVVVVVYNHLIKIIGQFPGIILG